MKERKKEKEVLENALPREITLINDHTLKNKRT